MIILLILILLAILYSTEQGRALLQNVVSIPRRIVEYPFELASEAKERALLKQQEERLNNFKKSFSQEELELIREEFIAVGHFADIREQINLYKKFKNGEVHKSYIKPEILATANHNNSLFAIKQEKIDNLRNKLNIN